MALQDYYNTNDDNVLVCAATQVTCQTFTANQTYTITSVKMKLWRDAGVTGTWTVNLYASSGNKPTGGILATGTIDVSTFATSTPGDWYEITFDTPYEVTGGNQYCVTGGKLSAGNVYHRCDATSPSYAGGAAAYSTNSGSTWTVYSTIDMMFETYDAGAGGGDAQFMTPGKFW